MTRITKSIIIEAPRQQVWAAVANLGDVYKFNPNVTKSYYSTAQKTGVGAARICELRPQGKIEEVATEWMDGRHFTLEIFPIEKAPPLREFYVSVDLTSLSNENTEVSITLSYATKLGVIGKLLNAMMIREQMDKAVGQILEGLKLNQEQGIEIEDPAALHQLLQVA